MATRYFKGEKEFFEAVLAYNLKHQDHKMVTRSEYYLDRNTDGEVIQISPNVVKRILAPFYLHGIGKDTLYLLKDAEKAPETYERYFDTSFSAYIDWLPSNREISWLGYTNDNDKGSWNALNFLKDFIFKEQSKGPIVLMVLGHGFPVPNTASAAGMSPRFLTRAQGNPTCQNIYYYRLLRSPTAT